MDEEFVAVFVLDCCFMVRGSWSCLGICCGLGWIYVCIFGMYQVIMDLCLYMRLNFAGMLGVGCLLSVLYRKYEISVILGRCDSRRYGYN